VVQRRIPRPGELAEILRPRPFVRNPVERRLSRAHTIDDLRRIGRRRTLRAVFDYVDGAAESEASLRRAREAFQRVEFHPNALRGAADVDLGVTVLGERVALPFAFAPTGFTRMIHHEGERAVAQVAGRNSIPYTLSTMGNTSIEDVAAASPGARKWFQLYVMRDRGKSAELMRAAWQSGYDTLMLTVDTPVAGARLRARHSGLTLPPHAFPADLRRRSHSPGVVVQLADHRTARIRRRRQVAGHQGRTGQHAVRLRPVPWATSSGSATAGRESSW
jgi:L-lactate dehydrogenase (cytochrome)